MKPKHRSDYVTIPRPYWELIMATMKLQASVLTESHDYVKGKMEALRHLRMQKKAGKKLMEHGP